MRGSTFTFGPSGFDRWNTGKIPLFRFSFLPLSLSLVALPSLFFSLFLSFPYPLNPPLLVCSYLIFSFHFLLFLSFFFIFLFLHFLFWITITRMVHKWETSSPLPPCHMPLPQIFLISKFFFIFPYVTHGLM